MMQAPALHDDVINCRPVSGVDVVQACVQVLLDVLGEEAVPAGQAPGATLAMMLRRPARSGGDGVGQACAQEAMLLSSAASYCSGSSSSCCS